MISSDASENSGSAEKDMRGLENMRIMLEEIGAEVVKEQWRWSERSSIWESRDGTVRIVREPLQL